MKLETGAWDGLDLGQKGSAVWTRIQGSNQPGGIPLTNSAHLPAQALQRYGIQEVRGRLPAVAKKETGRPARIGLASRIRMTTLVAVTDNQARTPPRRPCHEVQSELLR